MRKLFAVLGCTALAVATLASTVAGAPEVNDERFWGQWRGPLASGVAPLGNPPIEWSEDNNIVWKTEIPGDGFASPIVWEDRIFVLAAVPIASSSPAPVAAAPFDRPSGGPFVEDAPPPGDQRGQRRRGGGRGAPPSTMAFTVIALDRADGSVVWEQVASIESPHEGKQQNNSWASASAITDGEHVFAFFGSRGLYAYTMEGERVWDVDFGEMRIRGGFGEGSTPVLHDDKIVVVWDHQGDSFIAALDKSSGDELWRVSRNEPESWATPLVVETPGGTQVITAGERRTNAYDLDTGELIWEGPGLTTNPIPSPVMSNGVVFLMSGYRGNALRAVNLAAARGDIGDSAAILWEYNRDTPYVSSPLLYGDNLYFLKSNSPILTVFDAARGELLYGPQRLDGLQDVYASPVGAAGRVYIADRDGATLVIDAGGAFNVLATNMLDDGFEASPAIVGNELYLRGRRFLYRIEELDQPDG